MHRDEHRFADDHVDRSRLHDDGRRYDGRENYPCPPTAAQQAAGDFCVLAIGDTAGDRSIGTVLYGSETLPGSSTIPPTTTPTTAPPTTAPPTTTATTAPPTTAPPTTAPETGLTGAYELYCPGTPVGNVVLNDVTTTAAITPSSPNSGDTFNVTNYQTIANVPTSLASAALALGNTTLSGSATTQLDVTGATPATLSSGTINFSVPLVNPLPPDGITLDLPDPAGTLGPFTATSSTITVDEDTSASLTLEVSGNPLALTCTSYANNSVPTGITTSTPTGSPINPVIAVAGGTTTTTTPPTTTPPTTTPPTTTPPTTTPPTTTPPTTTPPTTTPPTTTPPTTTPPTTTPPTTTPPTTTPPTTAPPVMDTGKYELYCPGTPVGNVVLNDVTTSADVDPPTVTSGATFNVTNYQTIANVPSGLASAALALGNTALAGSANTQLDVTGATPATLSSGTISFSVPLVNPLPADGITLNLPDPAGTLGPFTATSNNVLVEEDSAASLTLIVSGSPLALTCTAYANDSVPTGITTSAPAGSPIFPIIATAGAPAVGTLTSTSTAPCTLGTACSIALTGSGFSPGETVSLALNDPVALGTATASATGGFTDTVTIPATTAAGSYSIVATGDTSGTTASFAVTVAAATTATTTAATTPTTTVGVVTSPTSSLALTGLGSGVRWLGVLGGVLVLFGLGMLFLVDAPRRMMGQLAWLNPSHLKVQRRRGKRTTGTARVDIDVQRWMSSAASPARWFAHKATKGPEAAKSVADTAASRIERAATWLLGRR